MIYYFLDTSALAKAYIPERGTKRVRSWIQEARIGEPIHVVVSRLVYPEAMSAITRRRNQGTLNQVTAKRIRRQLLEDFSGSTVLFGIVEADYLVVHRAALLVAQYGIRAFDAVQLSAALYFHNRLPAGSRDQFVFVSADKALTRAAQAERLTTADPATAKR